MSGVHRSADARLHRTVAALINTGLDVELLLACGPGVTVAAASAAAPPGATLRLHHSRGVLGRVVDAIRLPWQARGAVVFVLGLEPLPSARLRATLTGRRTAVAVDLYEDYRRAALDRAWTSGRSRALLRRVVVAGTGVATRLAKRVDLVVVADVQVPPGNTSSDRVRRRLVVRNLPMSGHLPAPVPPEIRPRAVYIGDIRASRGLDLMLDTMAASPGWDLDLVGPVASADQERLVARLAGDPDLASRVRLHGRLPPAQAWALAAGAWVGLAMLRDTPAFREAVPSKIYEYWACGLGVLVTPLPRQATLVTEVGAGQVVADAEQAAAALAEVVRRPDTLLSWQDRAQTWWQRQDATADYARLGEAVRALASPRN